MRLGRLVALPIVAGLMAGFAAVVPVLAADVTLESAIDGVMVFPNVAEVTRTSKIELDKGAHTLILNDLPAGVAANSIRVKAMATGGLSIASVDSRRRTMGQDESAELAPKRKELEEKIRQLQDERERVQGRIDAADAQGDLLRNLVGLPNQVGQTRNGDTAPLKAQDWMQFVGLIGTGLADVRKTIVEARQEQRELDEKITDLRAQLSELAPKQRQVTEARIFVNAEDDLEAELVVSYQVPGASWRPLYDARLETASADGKPQMVLTRRAIVTQRSGEDWENVAIRLSTTQPTAGSAAPELSPLTVDFRPRPSPAPVAEAVQAQDSRRMAMDEAPAQPRRLRGFGGAGRAKMAAAKPVAARVVNAPFQAIFEVPGRTTVKGNGVQKRLRISEEAMVPRLNVRAVPRRSQKAYLYAELDVSSRAPLLTGRVSLFRDGVFVGDGQLPTLVGGETHELGFGVDEKVRVKHAVTQEQTGETGLISSSRTDARRYKISVKNLHDRPIKVTILDQVPVAGDEDIKVTTRGTPPTQRDYKDKRGVLAWTSDIASGAEKVIDFAYTVAWPSDREIRYR